MKNEDYTVPGSPQVNPALTPAPLWKPPAGPELSPIGNDAA
jgi:hypothetical protein